MAKKRNNNSQQDAADVIDQTIAEATEAPVEETKDTEAVEKEAATPAVESLADDVKAVVEDAADAVKDGIEKAAKEVKEVAKDAVVGANVVAKEVVDNVTKPATNYSASTPDYVNQPTDKETTATATSKKSNLKAGGVLDLVNEPLYSSPYGSRPLKRITGRFYSYDGVNRNGYYRITNKKAYVKKDLKYIIGYIKK